MTGISTAVLHAIHDGAEHLEELSERLDRERRAIVKAVQVLKGRALVEIERVNRYDRVFSAEVPATRYVLTEAGREQVASGVPILPGQGPRPRKRTAGLRERAWWELRAQGIASLKQILITHADGSEKAADVNLYKYLVALERAGILARQAKRLPARQSRGCVQWRLLRDLGVKAPVWRQQAGEVYDPNAGAVYPLRPAAGEAEGEGDE